jgi:hypothetical protein
MTGAETESSRDRPRAVVEIDAAALSRVSSAPTWLRDLGPSPGLSSVFRCALLRAV